MIQRFAYDLTFFFSLWCFCLSNLPKHYFETFWIASLGSFSKPHFPLKNIMLLKDLFVVSLLLIFFFLFTYGYFHIPLFLFIFLVNLSIELASIVAESLLVSVGHVTETQYLSNSDTLQSKFLCFLGFGLLFFFCFNLKILLNLRSLYIHVIVSSLNSVGVDLNHKYWEPDVGWHLCVCQFISCVNWKTGLLLESELDTV